MKKLTIVRILALALCLSFAAAETRTKIPSEKSTRAYPVSAKRALHVDNENVRAFLIRDGSGTAEMICYVVPDGTAHLRLEITAADNPLAMGLDDGRGTCLPLTDLLDPAGGAYLYDQPTENADNGEAAHYSRGMLCNRELGAQDPDRIEYFLIRDEMVLDEISGALGAAGYEGLTWEPFDPEAAEDQEPARAYVVHVVDQIFDPVPEVYANFCTDTLCVMAKSDENGTIVFEGDPDFYHVQILRAPQGYAVDPGFELYTRDAWGEWVLYVWKE